MCSSMQPTLLTQIDELDRRSRGVYKRASVDLVRLATLLGDACSMVDYGKLGDKSKPGDRISAIRQYMKKLRFGSEFRSLYVATSRLLTSIDNHDTTSTATICCPEHEMGAKERRWLISSVYEYLRASGHADLSAIALERQLGNIASSRPPAAPIGSHGAHSSAATDLASIHCAAQAISKGQPAQALLWMEAHSARVPPKDRSTVEVQLHAVRYIALLRGHSADGPTKPFAHAQRGGQRPVDETLVDQVRRALNDRLWSSVPAGPRPQLGLSASSFGHSGSAGGEGGTVDTDSPAGMHDSSGSKAMEPMEPLSLPPPPSSPASPHPHASTSLAASNGHGPRAPGSSSSGGANGADGGSQAASGGAKASNGKRNGASTAESAVPAAAQAARNNGSSASRNGSGGPARSSLGGQSSASPSAPALENPPPTPLGLGTRIGLASRYYRAYLAPHARGPHAKLVRRLAGAGAYADRLESSPYADLCSDRFLRSAGDTFLAAASGALGLSLDCELSRVLRAGAAVDEALRRGAEGLGCSPGASVEGLVAGASSEKPCRALGLETAPSLLEGVADGSAEVLAELPAEMVTVSTVVCPIGRHVCSREDPPVVLGCGHVVSKETMEQLAQERARGRIKCPVCMQVGRIQDVIEMVF